MAEKTKDRDKLSVWELPRGKENASVNYMIKVPNVFKLQEYDVTDVQLNSPVFEFADTFWQIVIYASTFRQTFGHLNTFRHTVYKSIDISLMRLCRERRKHIIFSTVSLLDANNKKYDDNSLVNVYCGEEEVFSLHEFDVGRPSYYRYDILTFVIHLISEELWGVNSIQEIIPTNTEMANDCKISLSELQRKTIFSADYEIETPNFFALAEYVNFEFKISSQLFEFENASWQFLFKSKEKNEWVKSFDVFFMRLNSQVREHTLFYTISLLDAKDEVYSEYSGVSFYNECRKKEFMCVFHNDTTRPYHRWPALTLTIRLTSVESPEVDVAQFPANKELEDLSQDFKRLFLNGKNHDLTLRVGEKEFRAHKDVLMSRSPIFQSMLSHDMTEKNKGFIDIPDCDPQAMEQFLIYVYSGKVDTFNEDNAIGLYYIADKYNMPLLKEQCSGFIKKSLSPSIICDVIQLSLDHTDTDLLECATEYFLNHTDDILPTLEWLSFMKSNLNTANELLIKASKKWTSAKS